MRTGYGEQFSLNLQFVKICLLMMVVAGHVSAFWLPRLSELSTSVATDWPVIFVKGLSTFGGEAAIGFIFLSGFFTAHHFQVVSRDSQGKHAVRADSFRAMRHRLVGIYPQYLFALAFTVAIDTVGLTLFRPFYGSQTAIVFDPTLHASSLQVIANLLFLQPLFAHSLGTNGPLWTIGYLVQFYLAFTLCHALAGGAPLKWAGALIIAVVAFALGGAEWASFFVVWLAGASIRYRVPQLKGLPALIALLGSVLLFAVAEFAALSATAAGLVALAGYLMLITATWMSIGGRIMRSCALGWFADAAFSVYLLHMPILFFVTAVMRSQIGNDRTVFWFSISYMFVVLIAAAVHAITRTASQRFLTTSRQARLVRD